MITLLRVLLITQYVSLDTIFPWWLWLYAIIIEFDHWGMDIMNAKVVKYNCDIIQNMEAKVSGGQRKEEDG